MRGVLLGIALAAFACDANQTPSDGGDSPGPGPTTMPTSTATTAMPPPPGFYQVVGNKILDANGNPKHFHGLSRPSLEWAAAGENMTQGDIIVMKTWGANVIRLPLNQVYWATQPAYKTKVDEMVNYILGQNMDVILDLHRSEDGAGNVAQQCMANRNSLAFWTEVANKYKGQMRVLFELYNEPHDVSWDVWRNGGAVNPGTACGAVAYPAAGMQQMYDAVRATGAQNIVIAGGLDFAYDLRGVQTHALSGFNIAYATHPYDYNNKLLASWPTYWGFVAQRYPVFVTEFGITARGISAGSCSAVQYYADVIGYSAQVGAHWVAWAWYPKDCGFPSLIQDWNGTPQPAGSIVRNALLALPP